MKKDILFYCMPSLLNNLKDYYNYLKTNNYTDLKLTKENYMPFCGFNTGNHMFIKSIFRILDKSYNIILFSYSWNSIKDKNIIYKLYPEKLDLNDKKYNFIVFPCSNWLNQSFKIENYTILQNLFYENNIKCLFWGIGLQSSLNTKLVVSDKIQSFLNTAKLYDNIFIVRGNKTYNFIKTYINEKNILCAGCPSIFLNNDINLEDKINKKFNNIKNKLSIRLGFHLSQKMSISNEFENKYLNLINNENVICFPQTEEEIINKVYFDNEIFLLKKDENNIFKFDKNNFKYFFDVNEEIDFIKKNIDFVITTRIHGAIKTICAETPIILIYHDNRTFELGNMLKIPLISEKEFIENDLNTIINNFNLKDFQDNKIILKNKIKNFLYNYKINI